LPESRKNFIVRESRSRASSRAVPPQITSDSAPANPPSWINLQPLAALDL